MGMVVRTNMAALGANNSLAQASKAQQNGMQKLYTGFKINAAKDDASGLAISEKMKNQIKALDTAKDNCEDGANMIQTAEGYMKETHDILTRMTELAEKAANGLLKDEDRGALQNEMDQLCGEIDRMASTANFNGVKLLDGSLGKSGAVKVTCEEGKGFKVEGPEESTYKLGNLEIEDTSALESGKKYQVTAMSGDLKGVTATLSQINEEGTALDTDAQSVDISFAVKDGDTFTIDNNQANGSTVTTAGGFEVTITTVATADKGKTFTYDAASEKWMSDDDTPVAFASDAEITGIEDVTASATFDAENATSLDYTDEALNGINLQIGESSTTADRLNVSINSFHTDSLFKGLDGLKNVTNDNTDTAATSAISIKTGNDESTYKDAVTIDITDKDAASAAADGIRQISSYVSDVRGKLGAQQNRLDHTVNNLATASENTTAAKSRILDTDMAKEMMEYTSKNVIAQAAQSMLAQANSQPQNVLSLLQ